MGSLANVLGKREGLPETEIAGVAKQVLEGLRYLHGMSTVHRDVKPSNLLINDRGEVKIADFGLSRMLRDSSTTEDSCVGTYAYMSPKRLDPKRSGDGYDGFAGDVCVAMLECHVGHNPLISADQTPNWCTAMSAGGGGDGVAGVLELSKQVFGETLEAQGHCFRAH